MRDVHTIRLRGPWQIEPVACYESTGDGRYQPANVELPPATKDHMPADWARTLGSDFRGRVRYVRRFHAPSVLEELEQVWLVVEPPRTRATISLNDHPLGAARFSGPPARMEITSLIQDSNTLEIIVEHPELDSTGRVLHEYGADVAGGLVGHVWLEIGFPD